MYYSSLESMIKKYEETTREYAYRANSMEEHEAWKQQLRNRLHHITGMNKCRPALADAHLVQTAMVDDVTEEYWTIQTEPGVRMPFYRYVPEAANGSVMLFLHGHGSGKEAMKTYERLWTFCKELLADGFVVICPDERGSGDRREAWIQGDTPELMRTNSHRELTQAALGFGQCILGLAIWDLMRLVDYLESRPDVDSSKICCAGFSGGGQQSLWLTALDDRICASYVGGYFYGMLESLVKIPQNCACNFVPHMWETADMGDLGALIAPRPMMIESGAIDGLNGATGLDNVYPQVAVTKAAYGLFGAEDQLIHFTHPGGHEFVGDGAAEMFIHHVKTIR